MNADLIKCPKCGATLNVPIVGSGRVIVKGKLQVTCPKCGMVTLPGGEFEPTPGGLKRVDPKSPKK